MHIQTSNFIASTKVLLIWLAFWFTAFYLLIFAPYLLRFESPILNHIIFIILLLLVPFSLIWLARKVNGFWYGFLIFISITSLVPIAFVALMTYATTAFDENGKDLSFEKIDEIQGVSNYYRLYRTNGGATTSFGLVIRKEIPIILGLKLVSPIKGFSPASKGRFEKLTPESARLVILPNGYGKGEQIYEFKLH
ncbi:MAG: hypothetical protein HOO93_06770 [Methyloglobulus sp.]|nr:hypothetical protein [Methyloglobulus sp.]